MKSIDRLYIEVADGFLYNGRLPQMISQEEVEQLENTIRIRAGTYQAIGNSHQKKLIETAKETIRNQTKKTIENYVRDTLRERTRIKGTEITYGEVASDLCQHGGISPETKQKLLRQGPLSQEATDQLKKVIGLKVALLSRNEHDALWRKFYQRTQKFQPLETQVDGYLAELRAR